MDKFRVFSRFSLTLCNMVPARSVLLLVVAALVATAVGAPLSSAVAGGPMNLTLFQNAAARNVLCNDGTPSGYYIKRNPASSKWVVYLEGGGLCYDWESCRTRSKLLTSSDPWPKNITGLGLLSDDASNEFASFNKVIVIYCTSDLHSGNVSNKHFGLLKWNFHGGNVVPALLEDLSPYLNTATELLFTGGSAGGIGVIMNYHTVKASLPKLHVRALPDAGWFLADYKPYSSSAEPLDKMLEMGKKLWNGQVPSNCGTALGSRAHMCYSGPYAYPFLPSPKSDIMVLKAQTDSWTLGHDGVKAPFDAKELAWIMELAAEVRATFIADAVTNVFSADCPYHTCVQILWDQLKVSGTTLHQAVADWYFQNKTVSLVDSCTTPACNPTCV